MRKILMVFSNCPNNSSMAYVADTSFMINLHATEHAEEILKACALENVVITRQVLYELNRGEVNGHKDGEKVKVLIDKGLIRVVDLGNKGIQTYENLVSGATLDTLDDGEASTIGCVDEIGGIAIIDEKKAKRICASKYPHLKTCSTVDMLVSATVKSNLGTDKQSDAIFNALKNARMNISRERAEEVIAIIGVEKIKQCRSLSKYMKNCP